MWTIPLLAASVLAPPVPADASAVAPTEGIDWRQVGVDPATWRDLPAFEVLTRSQATSADGRVTGRAVQGRIRFEVIDDRPFLTVERWGGVRDYVRMTCDGETIVWGVQADREFERLAIDGDADRWDWLGADEVASRLGPANAMVLDLFFRDGLETVAPIGEARLVDLGPVDARAYACSLLVDEARTARAHVAFDTGPRMLPLAFALPRRNGTVVEMEFHDWIVPESGATAGTGEGSTPDWFHPVPPTGWTEVMTLRIDEETPVGPSTFSTRVLGRRAAATPTNDGGDLFDVDRPTAVLFHAPDDESSRERLLGWTERFDLDGRLVTVEERPSSDGDSLRPEVLARLWGIDALPAIVIVGEDRTVMQARSPWLGPVSTASVPTGD